MTEVIQPFYIYGSLHAPPGKSSMQRACAAALLHRGTSTIKNAGYSDDDETAIRIIQNLGAVVNRNQDGAYIIESNGIKPNTTDIKCGESGLSLRMFTPIAALSEQKITLSGKGSLLNRPMDFFDEILPLLHVNIDSNQGKLPISVQGPLVPMDITVDGSESSQYITGLLMAFSQSEKYPVSVKVHNPVSKPYIELTLEVMKVFGLNVPVNNDFNSFDFKENPAPRAGHVEYTVEGDWSSASFLLVAGAIAGSITVKGINQFSSQADKAILEALKSAGSFPFITQDEVSVNANDLTAFNFDATDCPDLFPPLVALAAYCKGESRINGIHRLRHKESNRALTLQEEFGKMGVEISFEKNCMHIKGGGELSGANIDAHNDHRIAMACAVAGLRANGETAIENAAVVNKSYPNFFNDLRSLKSK